MVRKRKPTLKQKVKSRVAGGKVKKLLHDNFTPEEIVLIIQATGAETEAMKRAGWVVLSESEQEVIQRFEDLGGLELLQEYTTGISAKHQAERLEKAKRRAEWLEKAKGQAARLGKHG